MFFFWLYFIWYFNSLVVWCNKIMSYQLISQNNVDRINYCNDKIVYCSNKIKIINEICI